MPQRASFVALAAAASLIVAACSDDPDTTSTPTTTLAVDTSVATTAPVATADGTGGADDIIEVATDAGSFTTLAAALEAAGLVEALQSEGPFTVFAPTDDAFAALPDGVLDALLKPENLGVLTNILSYHVIIGSAVTSDMVVPGEVEMANGATATIAVETQTQTFTGENISIGGDGVIVDGRNIDADGGNVSIGGGEVTIDKQVLTIEGAPITTTDVEASNGVIHAISAVMLPAGFDVSALLAG